MGPRSKLAAVTAAVALAGAALNVEPAAAEPSTSLTEISAVRVARAAMRQSGELFGYGWRETDDGVVHCTQAGNQVVCDRLGPNGAWYAQGVVNLYHPAYCPPVDFIGGWQGGPRAVLVMGGTGPVGCGLGLYPSTTQAFAAEQPWGKDNYEGLLELRPFGTNGGGPGVELNAIDACGSPGCPSSTRRLHIIIG